MPPQSIRAEENWHGESFSDEREREREEKVRGNAQSRSRKEGRRGLTKRSKIDDSKSTGPPY